jgi:putative ABC transport system permease protein
MTKKYFKLIIRDLIKRKSFSLINIAGIALGFSVCIITILYVVTEFSFDKHIPSAANKYRIIWGPPNYISGLFPYAFKEKIEPQLPDGSEMCIVFHSSGYLSFNHNDYKYKNILFSDSNFPSMFGTSLVLGNATGLLAAPLQIILSEHAAQTIFGNKNPINQTIKFWMSDFTVVGIFRDLPETSHLSADAVISVSSWKVIGPENLTSWGNKSYNYYLSLPSNINISQLQANIKNIYMDSDPGIVNAPKELKSTVSFTMEPITNIHLKSSQVLWDEDKNKGDFSIVITFIVIGLLILLMAGFNYINLSTAYFQTKNKIAGIQKVFGANRGDLIKYIFIQTSVLMICGLIFAIWISVSILPYFNMVVTRQISFSLLLTPKIFWIIFLVVFLMIILSGIYPALSFSKENPVYLLKRKAIQNSSSGLSLRKLLVILQFVISIVLISGIIVMGRQIRMMSSQKLGFNADQLIDVTFRIDKEHYELFKNKLESVPGVIDISACSNTPAGHINNENPFRLSSETDDKNQNGSAVVGIVPNYFKVMGIKLLEGENFSVSMEKKEVAILSKKATEMLRLSKAVGERVNLTMTGKDYTIVGVVDDAQYRSLREAPKAVIYLPDYDDYSQVVIRLGKGNHEETIKEIKKVWSSISPDVPFEFTFFDTKLQNNYAYEISIMRLLNILVVISIIISLLGIFGLIMEITIQRTKEIGIRKINGARVTEVMFMLSIDFLKWVAIAFLIASPIAWYAMHEWLQSFAYKTELSWWIFGLAGLLALVIALLTVSWQSWRAATRNPVEALRYE